MFNKLYVMRLSDETAHLERKRGLILVLFGCDGWLNTHNEKAPVPFIMEP